MSQLKLGTSPVESALVINCMHGCPSAVAPNRDLAVPVGGFMADGWTLLCNGVILFEDTGVLLPVVDSDGHVVTDALPIPVDPHRPGVEPEKAQTHTLTSPGLKAHLQTVAPGTAASWLYRETYQPTTPRIREVLAA